MNLERKILRGSCCLLPFCLNTRVLSLPLHHSSSGPLVHTHLQLGDLAPQALRLRLDLLRMLLPELHKLDPQRRCLSLLGPKHLRDLCELRHQLHMGDGRARRSSCSLVALSPRPRTLKLEAWGGGGKQSHLSHSINDSSERSSLPHNQTPARRHD